MNCPIVNNDGFLLEEIVFCNDGHLRVRYDNHQKNLPLSIIQKDLKQNNMDFLVTCFKSKVIFEEGLTVKDFFNCLSPWSDVLHTFTKKDVKSYIDLSNSVEVNNLVQDKFLYVDSISCIENGWHIKGEKDYAINHSLTRLHFLNKFRDGDVRDFFGAKIYLGSAESHYIRDNFISTKKFKKIKLNNFFNPKKRSQLNQKTRFGMNDVHSIEWITKKEYSFKEIVFNVLECFPKSSSAIFKTTEVKSNNGCNFEVVKDILEKIVDRDNNEESYIKTLSATDIYMNQLRDSYDCVRKEKKIKKQEMPEGYRFYKNKSWE